MSELIDPDEQLERMRANHGAFMKILGGRLEAADQARGCTGTRPRIAAIPATSCGAVS